jgi:hypothetical protein
MNEELKGIIDSMVANGETQEAINMVIAKYEAENCDCSGRNTRKYGFAVGKWFFGITNP